MKISVILCTYNRCQSLATALDSVAAQVFPESAGWEVLVVDNNSSDQTRCVVEECCRRHPGRFRYLFERQQGKSHALNAGIREASGSVLAFVDDDVTVEPTWLQNLTGSLRNGEWAGTGGRVLLQWSSSPPAWLSTDGPCVCHGLPGFDQGDEVKELARPPFGTNMAFRKEMFAKYGGFRTDMGPSPESEIRHEDVEFGHRLMAAGERLRYEPSAIVYHPVPENRIRKNYLLTWWFDYGRAGARERGRGPAVLGIPRLHLKIVKHGTILLALRVGRWLVARDPKRRFYYKCRVWTTAGQVKEYFSIARSAQTRDAQSLNAGQPDTIL